MIAWLWGKIGPWLAAVGAAIVAILAALAYGWHKGAKQRADADKAATADERVAQANAALKVTQSRQETDNEVAKLPDAPVQRIGDAKPGTAAGELGRWVRDLSENDPS